MPDIFDEVEEDLRAERARSFGRRYAGLMVTGAVLVLVGTGGYVGWSQHQRAQADAVADRFLTAARQADKDTSALGGLDRQAAAQAAANFADIAAHGPPGYAVLARLRLAALQWQLGQTAQAIASWQAVTDDTGAPPLLRDLALLTSAEHQIDTANPALLKQSVATATAFGNPWRPLAEQVIALLDLRMGKTRESAERLKRLQVDPDAPEGVRQMVADLIATLPPEAAKPTLPPEAAKPTLPPEAAKPDLPPGAAKPTPQPAPANQAAIGGSPQQRAAPSAAQSHAQLKASQMPAMSRKPAPHG